MLKFNTVFVIGAGASMPFSFPSGAGLFSDIRRLTPDDLRVQLGGLSKEGAAAFAAVIGDSQEESLDAMLEQQPVEFQAAGKRFIATQLLRAEYRFQSTEYEGDWFRYLFSRMAEGIADLDGFLYHNPVSFVTYNYDRLIEHRLMAGMRAKYGATNAHWPKVMERVVHLHGSLGTLHESPLHVPFAARDGTTRHLDAQIGSYLEKCESAIKIVHEPKPADDAFKRARELLSRAERVVFLGFGFGKTNVDRLGFSEVNKDAQIFYTWRGMTKQEHDLYVAVPFAKCGFEGIRPSDENWDCLRLIRERIASLVTRY